MKSRLKIILVPVLIFLLFLSVAPLIASEANHEPVDHNTSQHVEEASAEAHTDGHNADGHGADAAHGASDSLSPEKIKDFIFRALNFAALLFILIYFLAKPLGQALNDRRTNVASQLEEMERKRDEAELAFKEYESKLAGMEKHMDEVVEKAAAQAESEKVRILAEAENQASEIKRQAEAAVAAATVEARKSLVGDISRQAATVAQELMVNNLKEDDHIKIIETYLDRVEATQ